MLSKFYKKCKEIVDRYADFSGDQLLPFESSERYNDNIKIIFEKAGVTYFVTKLDTVTRTEVKVPINEIASSHMARRTFIGNIYKLVKDPNLCNRNQLIQWNWQRECSENGISNTVKSESAMQ